MKAFLKECLRFRYVLLGVLFLTPIGIALAFIKEGIEVDLGDARTKRPMSVHIKATPTKRKRIIWLTQGIVVLGQAAWITFFTQTLGQDGSDIIAMYAILGWILGPVGIVSAIYPKIPWNKKLRI